MMTPQTQRVVLFGELLMRLATPQRERFVQAQTFEVAYTGGEANAGVLLAGLGVDAVLVSVVPDNDIGQACVNHMRRFGLDTTHVRRTGPRLGTLYLELGASQRPSKVIYDRAGSSFSQLGIGDVPWENILRDATWLHFTGTAPALSPELADLTLQACQIARRLEVPVSCDLNYRTALWSIDDARATMQRIVPHVDLLIANEEHANLILDAPLLSRDDSAKAPLQDRYSEILGWLRKQYGLSQVALTIRGGNTADDATFVAVIDDGQQCCASRQYAVRDVDRIGAGDAFSGALIYGLSQKWQAQRTIQFAAAAACLKHTVHGDFCIATLQEIERLVSTDSDGRVLR